MKLITAKGDIEALERLISCAVEKRCRLPEFVFKRDVGWYLFLVFERIFTKDFFGGASEFAKKCGDDVFWVSVLDPDPEEYFFKHFLHYGAIECRAGDSGEDYVSALNADPGGSPADALIHNSNAIVVCSPSVDWIIFGDRDSDAAVCQFRSELKRDLFISVCKSTLFADTTVAEKFPFYVDRPGNPGVSAEDQGQI